MLSLEKRTDISTLRSSTVFAIGPIVSKVRMRQKTPSIGTALTECLRVNKAARAEGHIKEPVVSDPMAGVANSAATLTAEPEAMRVQVKVLELCTESPVGRWVVRVV